MKRKISKVLLTLFFFVLIANICSAQNSSRGIAAEKTLSFKSFDEPEIWVENILGINCEPVAFTSDFSCVVLESLIGRIFYIANFQTGEYFCIGKKTAKISKDEKYLCIFYSNEDCVVYDLKSKEKTDIIIDDFLEIEKSDCSEDDVKSCEKQVDVEDCIWWYNIKEKASNKVYLGVGEAKLYYGIDLINKKKIEFNSKHISNYRQQFVLKNEDCDSIIATTTNNELSRFNLEGRLMNVYKNGNGNIEDFYQDNNYLIVFYTKQLCVYNLFSSELVECFALPDDFPFINGNKFYLDLINKIIFVYNHGYMGTESFCKYIFDSEKQTWNYCDIDIDKAIYIDPMRLPLYYYYEDNRYKNYLFYSAYDDLYKQEIIALNLDDMDIEFEFRLNLDLDKTLKKCFKENSIDIIMELLTLTNLIIL